MRVFFVLRMYLLCQMIGLRALQKVNIQQFLLCVNTIVVSKYRAMLFSHAIIERYSL